MKLSRRANVPSCYGAACQKLQHCVQSPAAHNSVLKTFHQIVVVQTIVWLCGGRHPLRLLYIFYFFLSKFSKQFVLLNYCCASNGHAQSLLCIVLLCLSFCFC